MISPRNIVAAAVRFIRERPLIIVVLLLLAVAGVVMISRARRTVSAQHVYYPARRGDFTVTILEGGTLRAAQEVTVRCELEGRPSNWARAGSW